MLFGGGGKGGRGTEPISQLLRRKYWRLEISFWRWHQLGLALLDVGSYKTAEVFTFRFVAKIGIEQKNI